MADCFFENLFVAENWSDDHTVAMDATGAKSWRQFRQQVRQLADQLNADLAQRYLLFFESSYQFAVAFFSLALARKTIVLPPNIQSGTLLLLANYFDACITDVKDFAYSKVIKLPLMESSVVTPAVDSAPITLAAIDPEIEVVVATSGSTGEPKLITKKLRHFITEVKVLEQVWGDQLQQAQFESTVSHQHIYGLLFRLMWPLTTGRPFAEYNLLYPEHVQEALQRKRPFVLVSSPAFIKRFYLQCEAVTALAQLYLRQVFSSGGPLAPTDNQLWQQLLHVPVTEVFGSSEIGGVGHRTLQFPEPDLRWQAFPGVALAVTETGLLQVQSPHVYSTVPFIMSDKAELLDDLHFVIKGRADCVVKIEEKRISLTEMEQRLLECGLIVETRVIVLESRRDQLGVVAVLSDSGWQQLQRQGKRTFAGELRDYLSRYFEPVALPRKWRFVEVLPYNSQGKLVLRDLAAMFVNTETTSKGFGGYVWKC